MGVGTCQNSGELFNNVCTTPAPILILWGFGGRGEHFVKSAQKALLLVSQALLSSCPVACHTTSLKSRAPLFISYFSENWLSGNLPDPDFLPD